MCLTISKYLEIINGVRKVNGVFYTVLVFGFLEVLLFSPKDIYFLRHIIRMHL
jgi:hypothetical protein